MASLRVLILLVLGGLSCAVTAAEEEWPRLRLCYELGGLPPYTHSPAETAAEEPGLIIELIQQAAYQAKLRLDLHQQPWKRCVHEVQQGHSDGLFIAVWQPDRDTWGRYPGRDPQRQSPVDANQRLWRVEYPIIVRPGGALQWDGQRFSGVRHGVGAPLGYATSQRLRELGVLASESLAQAAALRLVAAGRLDGYVLEREIALELIERLQLQEQLMFLPQPLLETDWYLPLSHQFYSTHPELAEGFWRAVAEQRQQLGADLSRRYLRQPAP
ncbi:hypothetical protein HNE05_06380 [Aquipseudomonas campi]|uniref:Amino acid ABC transporter substrate-binding protein n=1 Tax=Aquipseudomonas campi TaxID=2731681 RepID=A0A6M8FFM0_9GAMM|nr:hypothetical protein [Pseudomonas campi]QKE63002.1 hypothetical protein HNE05_06380 [Pseudomonas campi]